VGCWAARDSHLSARAAWRNSCASTAPRFDDIVHGLDLPRTFVEEALAELVGVGLVNSDGFSGLRALLLPSDKRKPFSGGGRRRAAMPGVEDAGRWALIRRKAPAPPADGAPLPRETVEQIARTLLRRYGVVFWRMLAREAQWLPPWRELLLAYRRLETRGDIRGGRFVAGFSGEQFALPEAVGVLRSARRDDSAGALRCCAAPTAQPGRHRHPRTQGACAVQQPAAAARRHSGRGADRRRGAHLRTDDAGSGVGRA
jgi:ATP-dependent Lhr-like helicase